MFLGAAMIQSRSIFFSGLLWFAVVSGALAAGEDYAARFAREQAEIATLSASNAYEDQHRLAEILNEGVQTSAANPLRRADRDRAIVAYRRALELGDPSASAVVNLGRLILRDEDLSLEPLVPALQQLMLQGNGDAAYLLALYAAQSNSLPQDQLAQRLKSAATMGSVSAVLDLEVAGVAVGKTVATAMLEKLEEKARTGGAGAAFTLYQLYDRGGLVERNPPKSLEWLKRAVELGDVTALERLAEHVLHGNGIAADPQEALRLYRDAAEHGNVAAAMVLGRAAISGVALQVPQDEGRLWLYRASEIHAPGAAVELSNLDLKIALALDDGDETKASRIAAALAPIAGDADALANLANKYWRTPDANKIAKALLPLLESQALAGNAPAALSLNAWLEAHHQPLPLAVAQALVTGLRKTPVESTGLSNFMIAKLALDGRVPQEIVSRQEALGLLFKAADANVGRAMLMLGQLYMHGDQLAQSPSFAKRWLLRAQAQDVEPAYWALAALQAQSNDPVERREAERFYLQQIDFGDPRAALALVRHKLRWSTLDAVTLAQAKAAVIEPRDVIALAEILISTGMADHVEAGRKMLATLTPDKLPPDSKVAYGRLLMLMSTSQLQTEAALELQVKAAETGDPAAKVTLASTYLSSVVFADRRAEAVELLNQVLADNPYNPQARMALSKAYLMGLGVSRDAQRASELVASVRDDIGYTDPKVTIQEAEWLAFSKKERDPQGSVALLKAQVARGSVAAERALGEAYLNGFGPSIEPDAAAHHMYEAAINGDKDAMAGIGHMLLNGYGLSQSREEGLTWLARAAAAGNTAAMYDMSRVLALTPEGRDDAVQAVAWLQKAAERNHPNAAYQLGLTYLKGEWVEKDVVKALEWFQRSAATGSLLAARTLKAVRAELPGQEADALDNVEEE